MKPTLLAIACIATLTALALVAPTIGASHVYKDPQGPNKCLNKNEDEPAPGVPNGHGGYSCSPAIWTGCIDGSGSGTCMVCTYYEYRYDHAESPPGSGMWVPNDSRYYSGCVP